MLTQSLVKGRKSALGAIVPKEDLVCARVDVVVARLVDGVVGQMHESFLVVGLSWRLILSCAESGETFVVNKCLDWIQTNDSDIDSEIELEAI